MDIVHALFKSSVVDICKREGEWLLGTRAKASIPYPDKREIVYTFDVSGLATFAQVLEHLGMKQDPNRPPFKEGDKELIAQAITNDIKKKHAKWSDFLDDRIEFKAGGKGYAKGSDPINDR